jgi:hypothetical protein
MDAKLRLHIDVPGWLNHLLPRSRRGPHGIEHYLSGSASIKDVLESLGIPHTEIGRLLVNGREVDFSYNVHDGDKVQVFPWQVPADPLTRSLLRPDPLPDFHFLADANVGKLATLLRLVGLDTAYYGQRPDQEMAEISAAEKRLLLTRDVQLLKRKIVIYGHLVREPAPPRQLAEIVHLYGLRDRLKPGSRCLLCNRVLVPVDKDSILHRLEPLTRKYYHSFHLCRNCDKIYWAGSHTENMQQYLDTINQYQPLPQ